MAVSDVTLLFAILALILAAFLIAVAAGWFVARDVTGGVVARIRPFATEIGAAIAVTCTLGSLYLSEVADFDPCYLCWVQRFFMYPAAVLLIVALLTGWIVLTRVAALLAIVGLPVSIFHRIEQEVGEIGDFCEATNPCGGKWVNEFGFMTIPTMAGIGFVGVLFFAMLGARSDRSVSLSVDELV